MPVCSSAFAKASAVFVMLTTFSIRAQASDTASGLIPGFEKRDSSNGTYVANALSVVHSEITSGSWPFSSTSTYWRIVRGNYRQPVTYVDFLRAIGRPDLADSYSSRCTLATTLFWSGLGIFVAGGVVVFYGVHNESDRLMITGLGIGGAGLLLAHFGGSGPDLPLSEADAAAAVAEWNRRLADQLGISQALAAPSKRGLTLVPAAGPHSLGLAGTYRF